MEKCNELPGEHPWPTAWPILRSPWQTHYYSPILLVRVLPLFSLQNFTLSFYIPIDSSIFIELIRIPKAKLVNNFLPGSIHVEIHQLTKHFYSYENGHDQLILFDGIIPLLVSQFLLVKVAELPDMSSKIISTVRQIFVLLGSSRLNSRLGKSQIINGSIITH